MATFYGQVEGNNGPATRCGSKMSGISASLQNYDGSIQARMYYGSNGELRITVSSASGSKPHGETVFMGTVERFIEMCRKEMQL